MRINPRGRAAFIAALAMLASTTGVAATAPLTLDDALRIFRTRGFDLIIADASIASAAGDVTIAKSVANPSLSAKDAAAQTLAEWLARPESDRFRFDPAHPNR